MGERFYLAQKAYKPPRRLKKDFIEPINQMLGVAIAGLDKCTIATLEELENAIEALKNSVGE